MLGGEPSTGQDDAILLVLGSWCLPTRCKPTERGRTALGWLDLTMHTCQGAMQEAGSHGWEEQTGLWLLSPQGCAIQWESQSPNICLHVCEMCPLHFGDELQSTKAQRDIRRGFTKLHKACVCGFPLPWGLGASMNPHEALTKSHRLALPTAELILGKHPQTSAQQQGKRQQHCTTLQSPRRRGKNRGDLCSNTTG